VNSTVAFDILLPPSGAVSGRVFDSSGVPVPLSRVGLMPNGQDFGLIAESDALGNFGFTQVPLGSMVVQAEDLRSGVLGSGAGALAGGGQTATVNVSLPYTAAVLGRVTAAGVALPSADLTVQSFAAMGPLGTFRRFGTTDVVGAFGVTDVPVGGVRASATDPNNVNSVGLADGTLALPGPLTVNVPMGNAVRLGQFNLDGTDGFRYDVGCWGELVDGGTADRRLTHAFFGASLANVENPVTTARTACVAAAGTEVGGRQLVIGPGPAMGLTVTRKVFVPVAGKFVRYLEVLTNSSPAAISVNLAIEDPLSANQLLVSPASTNNRYMVVESTQCCHPVVALVTAGTSASLQPTLAFDPTSPSYVRTIYPVTLAAGQTISVLHFVVQRDINNSSGASSQAQALSSLTDPDALTGLSAAEKAQIRNFIVP
jgi:hypothetical protein